MLEFLTSMHKAVGLIPTTAKTNMVVWARYGGFTLKLSALGAQTRGSPEYGDSLDSRVRACLKKRLEHRLLYLSMSVLKWLHCFYRPKRLLC